MGGEDDNSPLTNGIGGEFVMVEPAPKTGDLTHPEAVTAAAAPPASDAPLPSVPPPPYPGEPAAPVPAPAVVLEPIAPPSPAPRAPGTPVGAQASTIVTRAPPPMESENFILKRVHYCGREVPIICQGKNGPCPLLAICNVMLLRGALVIPDNYFNIAFDELMSLLATHIVENARTPADAAMRANHERNITDAISLLPYLRVGLDVNVKFKSPTDLEFTQEMVIFDLLNINMMHGWIVAQDDTETYSVLAGKSYNQLVELLITDTTDDAATRRKLLAENFLQENPSQLTYGGLIALHDAVKEGELCVFFRNNHFSTLTKSQGRLFLLLSDLGYAREQDIVWERFDQIDGDNTFYTGQFAPFVARAPQAVQPAPAPVYVVRAAPPPQQHLSDEELARQLQLEEDNRARQQPMQPMQPGQPVAQRPVQPGYQPASRPMQPPPAYPGLAPGQQQGGAPQQRQPQQGRKEGGCLVQ